MTSLELKKENSVDGSVKMERDSVFYGYLKFFNRVVWQHERTGSRKTERNYYWMC